MLMISCSRGELLHLRVMDEVTRHDASCVAQVIAEALEEIIATRRAQGRLHASPPNVILWASQLHVFYESEGFDAQMFCRLRPQ